MSVVTIKDHLIRCAEVGLVGLHEYIPSEFKGMIQEVTNSHHGESLKSIKEQLPAEDSYFMIKAFLADKEIGKS